MHEEPASSLQSATLATSTATSIALPATTIPIAAPRAIKAAASKSFTTNP